MRMFCVLHFHFPFRHLPPARPTPRFKTISGSRIKWDLRGLGLRSRRGRLIYIDIEDVSRDESRKLALFAFECCSCGIHGICGTCEICALSRFYFSARLRTLLRVAYNHAYNMAVKLVAAGSWLFCCFCGCSIHTRTHAHTPRRLSTCALSRSVELDGSGVHEGLLASLGPPLLGCDPRRFAPGVVGLEGQHLVDGALLAKGVEAEDVVV